MTPYYEDADGITIIHADCRAILPQLGPVDLVLTDPPYGIGKAEWDTEFPLWWMDSAMALTPLMGVMPGTWNLLRLPQSVGDADYKWTLAAHLSNGMTRGGLGFGNWIPCVVYEGRRDVAGWCRKFADWCNSCGITRNDLDRACGTSDMGGWWMSRLPHRCAIPSRSNWKMIDAAFHPDPWFWNAIRCADYSPCGDCRSFAVGSEDKPNHPSPKPMAVVSWFLECLPSEIILDPFMGSGTTLVAAKRLGRRAIGVEIEEKYCEIAAERLRREEKPLFAAIKSEQFTLGGLDGAA